MQDSLNGRIIVKNVFALPSLMTMANLLVSKARARPLSISPFLNSHFPEMVRAIVSDGITIGHPCCSVAHCTEPLENVKRDRFCPGHQYRLDVCAIEDCEVEVLTGHLTCGNPTHRKLEEKRRLRNAANFQMRPQLQRTTVSNPPDEEATQSLQADGEPLDEGIEEVELPVDQSKEASCPQKPESGNRRITARFGRRQTHNEQLMVRPCGMIVARTTFFGSETVPQTVVSTFYANSY